MTPKSSMAFFLEGLQDEAWSGENEKTASGEDQTEEKLSEPAKKEVWNALAKFYLSDENWKEEAVRLLKASYVVHSDEPISHAVTQALYGTVLENSVTRLEHFAACAYAHYLNYGLRLRERQLLEFASVDMGNIYHDALEHFSRRVEK